jgi:hypothetical protein
MTNQPYAAMPLHDPDGIHFPHLARATPQLTSLFERVFVSISAATAQNQPDWIEWLEREPFYHALYRPEGTPVGEQFRGLYDYAVEHSEPERVLHLCFPDRVAFALGTEHRDAFSADVGAITADGVPLLFERSEAAWATHPRNYRDVEAFAIRAGEWLLGRSLDWTWCHLAVQVQQLSPALPYAQSPDLSMLAQILLHLRGQVTTRQVDWLAWEDPFILGRDPALLRREREGSPAETKKRLSYVIPTLQVLVHAAGGWE